MYLQYFKIPSRHFAYSLADFELNLCICYTLYEVCMSTVRAIHVVKFSRLTSDPNALPETTAQSRQEQNQQSDQDPSERNLQAR